MLKAWKKFDHSKEIRKTQKQFSLKVRRMWIQFKGKEKQTDDEGQGRMSMVRSSKRKNDDPFALQINGLVSI